MTDARAVALALGARQQGNGWMARCVVHDDRSPSMSIKDGDLPGRVLFKCFAGCQSSDIVTELRRRGILDAPSERGLRSVRMFVERPVEHHPDPYAIAKWKSSRPGDSILDQYFYNRGIDPPVPPSLRATNGPAMVAAVQAPDGTVIAVQTTKLTSRATRAQVVMPRITVGALGLGAVRLAKAGEVLGLAEGVESGLSAMQINGIPTWCCLGAARMHRVAIPATIRELHIFADNDDAGRIAAERTAAAHKAIKVTFQFPPDRHKDWNDVLNHQNRRAASQ
jgi:hypothetical protein